MAFLQSRVSPEPLCPTTSEGETELLDCLHLGEKDKDHFNNNGGTETSIIVYRDANECQDGLDGIPEEQLCRNDNGLFQNGKITPDRRSAKRNKWSNPEGNISSGRYHTCDRVVLLAVCVMSAASLLLSLLMLFGIVGPLNCACSGRTGGDTLVSNASYEKLAKNVQNLEKNVSSLRETSATLELEKIKTNVTAQLENIRTKVQENEIRISSAQRTNSSVQTQNQSTTSLWLAVQRLSALWPTVNISVSEKLTAAQQEIVKLNKSGSQKLIAAQQEIVKLNKSVSEKLIDVQQEIVKLNKSVSEKLINVQQEIEKLDEKVNNISKTGGSNGPPGYNGTQGVAGPPGPPGIQGPPGHSESSGSGNVSLTLCSYKTKTSTGETPDTYAIRDVQETESNGKKILGVNCESNDAKFIRLSSTMSGGERTYKCTCTNTLNSGDATMFCYIQYWECPT